MLTKNDKADLKWAMQASLLENTSKVLSESKLETAKEFILTEATYEQMLNLCFNPNDSSEVYMEAEVLETMAKEFITEMVNDKPENCYQLLESIILEKKGEVAPGVKMTARLSPKQKKQVEKELKDAKARANKEIKDARVAAAKAAEAEKAAVSDQAKESAKKNTEQAQTKLNKIKTYWLTKTQSIANKLKTAGEKTAEYGSKLSSSDSKMKNKIGSALSKAGKYAAENPRKVGGGAAAGAVALATGAYYLYRKMRKSGKTQAEAAEAAASAAQRAGDMAASRKWKARAAKAKKAKK